MSGRRLSLALLSGHRRALAILAGTLVLVAALLGLRRAIAEDPLARLRKDELGRHGSWWFPRGGPYILGFDAPGAAELEIDGKRITVGTGRAAQRVVFEAGAHAVTFRGPPGSRLLWHPPGRRGAHEYVPPSSLSPEPPERARFGSGAGASRGDAAIATAILLVLAGGGLLLARPKLGDRRALLVFGGVFVLAFAVRLAGLGAAGQTWDEDEYWSSGRNYLVNLLSLDFSDASWRWNFEHPPMTKYVAGLGALWQDGYGAARALFALLSAGTCVLAAAIAARLFCLRAGVFAGLICALTPHLVGHAQIVGHETPSVFFWTLAVWLALRVHDGGTTRVRRLAWIGVALGLAASTRFANLLVAPVVGVALLLLAPAGQRLRTIALGALVVPAAAIATFVAVWPRMWTHPFAHLGEAWEKLRLPHTPEPYLGQYLVEPPWHYFVVYVLAVTPVVLLVLAAVGGTWRALQTRQLGWWIVLVWLIAPFGIAWSPVRQDGVRYVLAVLVPLAIAAGAGVDHLASVLGRLSGRTRHAAPVLGALLGVYLAITCVRIAPYYIDYYAEPVGGAGRAQQARLFEVGWWGEGIDEAVTYVNAHAPEGARLFKLLQPTHVNWFRGDLWKREAGSPAQADWIVVNDAGIYTNDVLARRPRFTLPADAELVHEVRAGGASLARVYRRPARAP